MLQSFAELKNQKLIDLTLEEMKKRKLPMNSHIYSTLLSFKADMNDRVRITINE
jgi:hypothetical protein